MNSFFFSQLQFKRHPSLTHFNEGTTVVNVVTTCDFVHEVTYQVLLEEIHNVSITLSDASVHCPFAVFVHVVNRVDVECCDFV